MDTGLLEAALIGYQVQRTQIQAAIADIERQIGGRAMKAPVAAAATSEVTPTGRKKRTMSAAARKRIAAAQKKRWADFHAAKQG